MGGMNDEVIRFNKPSLANQRAFDGAVDDVAKIARRLIDSLVTQAPPRDREEVAAKARAEALKRFGADA